MEEPFISNQYPFYGFKDSRPTIIIAICSNLSLGLENKRTSFKNYNNNSHILHISYLIISLP